MQNKIALVISLILLPLLLGGCTISKDKPTVTQQTQNNEQKNSMVIADNGPWKQYINPTAHYEVQIPSEIVIKNGSCISNPETGIKTYKEASVKLGMYEEENITYLVPTYIYGDNSQTNECEELITDKNISPQEMVDNYLGWKIYNFTDVTLEDLPNLIKKEFGTSCDLEVTKPTKNPNIFDVVVKESIENDEETQSECKIETAYFFKYNLKTQTAVLIKLGQEFTFYSDDGYKKNPLDEQILNSFKFTE